ncbi:MAG: NAD(+)/NADH kinase [Bacteroidota bacterium]
MKVGIMGNRAKKDLWRVAKDLVGMLTDGGARFVVDEELARWVNKEVGNKVVGAREAAPLETLPGRCDVLVAFGGDGTILSAARLVGRRGIPILGVNLGKLGFLAEFAVEDMEEWVGALLRRKYKVEERMVLEASTRASRRRRFYGLNDIVIDKSGSSRVIDLQTFVNDEHLITYTADGLIVATPTGSTAYSLATGGPIVVPESKAITLSPICPHTLTARPVIVPDSSSIRVVIGGGTKAVHITADGQVEEILHPPLEFLIRKANYSVRLVKRLDRSYYDVLRAKLMWGRDVRVDVTRE